MIRNYLTIALRNFQRQKLFALLNMVGLALGLASATLIFLYVSDELQYDVMHPHYDNTYRIGCTFTNPNGQVFDNTTSPGFWVKHLLDTRTEVVDGTRVDYIGYPTSLHHKPTDKIILTEEIKWAEPGFDDIINFNLVKGNQDKMFEDHYTVLLSETGARRLFDGEDPLGEVISVKHPFATQGREIDVMISGVYRDFPSNSHFKPKYIVNVNAFRSIVPNFTNYLEGTRFADQIEFFENYIVVKPGSDIKAIQNILNDQAQRLIQADSATSAAGFKMTAFLTKMSDLHFDEKNLWENDSTRGDRKYLIIFSAVAVLILLIACINYMNLATARSSRRAKEVGLRKSLGSKRSELAKQFLYESMLMTLGSLVIAMLLVFLLLHPFNQLAHKTFTIASLLNPYMIAVIFLIVLFMAFLSGSYPAFYLSAFRPVDVLKGQVIKGRGAEIFRKSLVTIQYAVSLILIISTFIVVSQMEHMQNTKLNQQGSQLLSIRYGGIAEQQKFAAFKQAVLEDKDIEHVTMANHLPRLNYFGYIGANVRFPEIEDKTLQWNKLNVDFDFAKTYTLEFVAGRDFDVNNVSDSSSLILNEAAVRALNQPLEKIMGASVVDVNDQNRGFKVIGVVKDFPFRSMHQTIEPLILNPRVHFIDELQKGAPEYTLLNSGVMFHSQDPNTILKEQNWPISVEMQFLAGLGDGNPRPTGNMCSPGTEIVFQGERYDGHCLNSNSKTFDKDEWIRAELIVLGDSLVSHLINGDTVLQYSQPTMGGGVVDGYDSAIWRVGKALSSGYIGLQSEGQPINFRNIELMDLSNGVR